MRGGVSLAAGATLGYYRFIAAEFVDGVTLRERVTAGPVALDEIALAG
jgi:hypothetical protein